MNKIWMILFSFFWILPINFAQAQSILSAGGSAVCRDKPDSSHTQIVVDVLRIHADRLSDNRYVEKEDEVFLLALIQYPASSSYQVVRLPGVNSYWNIEKKIEYLSGDNNVRRVACLKLARGETAKVSIALIDKDDRTGDLLKPFVDLAAKYFGVSNEVMEFVYDYAGDGADDVIGSAMIKVKVRQDGSWSSSYSRHSRGDDVLRCQLNGTHANIASDCPNGLDISAIHYFFETGGARYDFDFWVHQ